MLNVPSREFQGSLDMPYCITSSNNNWCCELQRLRKCGFVWKLSATAWQSSISAVSVSLADEMDRIE
jgi:hypothetical protein